jgi:hypothetical protein
MNMSSPSTQPSQSNSDTVNFLLQHALREIDTQNDDRNGLDTKTGVVLGFALVSLAQIVAALFTLPPDKMHVSSHPHILAVLFIGGSVAVALATVCGLLALRPTPFESFSVADDLAKPNAVHDQLSSEILAILRDAIPGNDARFAKKARHSERTVYFVGIAVFCYTGVAALIFWPLLK